MKVVVLGAGVIGATTAWFLARHGHEVIVLDRQPGPGLETSFANGGQISPCHAEPWANPHVIPKMLKWLGRDEAPLQFNFLRYDPELWAWGLRFLRNCLPGRSAINIERTLRVALYSRNVMQEIREETNIAYDQRLQGILHIYKDSQEFDHACAAADLMGQYGLRRLQKTPNESVQIEPALAPIRHDLAGGIYTPDDESGDAHLFTREIAQRAAQMGADFRYNTQILGPQIEGGQISAIRTTNGLVKGDIYILAMASYSPAFAKQLGITLPIIPAKGYSLTVPVEAQHLAPEVSITYDEFKIVFSRLGSNRLRIAGTAEMDGHNLELKEKRWRTILNQAKSIFPQGGDWDRAQAWCGLRPVTPDSVPIIGRCKVKNLLMGTGHGTLGWTMAAGTAKILADLVADRAPEIDLDRLGPERF